MLKSIALERNLQGSRITHDSVSSQRGYMVILLFLKALWKIAQANSDSCGNKGSASDTDQEQRKRE